jgi:hypothetical protein
MNQTTMSQTVLKQKVTEPWGQGRELLRISSELMFVADTGEVMADPDPDTGGGGKGVVEAK